MLEMIQIDDLRIFFSNWWEEKTDRGAQPNSSVLFFFGCGHQDAWEDAGAEERCSIKTSRQTRVGRMDARRIPCSGGLVIFSTCFVFLPDPNK